MRFSVVYVAEDNRWGVVDWLTSDEPFELFSTEWDALGRAQDEERRWQMRQISYPKRAVAYS